MSVMQLVQAKKIDKTQRISDMACYTLDLKKKNHISPIVQCQKSTMAVLVKAPHIQHGENCLKSNLRYNVITFINVEPANGK